MYLRFLPNQWITHSLHTYYSCTCWGISVSTVSDYRLDDQGSIPGTGKGFFLYPLCPDQLWGPPSLLSNGYWGTFPEVKAPPWHDTDHSPHLVSRSKMSRSYIPLLPPSVPAWQVAGQLYYSCTSGSAECIYLITINKS
jgi:hypothetical protein